MPFLLALWLFAAGAAGRAAIPMRSWTPIGPMDGARPVATASVAFDPIARVLYAGSAFDPGAPDSTRVFRKPASRGEWRNVGSPGLEALYPYLQVTTDSVGFVYASVVSCLIHPGLGCGGGLARSADAGEHWNRLRTRATAAVTADPFNASNLLAVEGGEAPDPIFPAHVTFFGTALRSRDGGVTWTESELPPSPSSFAFDPGRVATVFAATLADGVWKSVDSGETWSATGEGIDSAAFSIAVDGSGVIFVTTDRGLFVSRDGGDRWLAASPALAARELIADMVSGGAYVGLQAGVFHVDEAGFAVPIGSGVSNVTGLATDGQRVWAATLTGVFEFEIRDRRPRTAPDRGP